MNIVKVNNLLNKGRADYKGLDLSKIQSGTQLYPNYDNVAYFFYDGEVIEGGDISIVNQATYDEHKQKISNEVANVMTPDKELEQLKQNQSLMQKALDDLIMNGGAI